jgi:hypothetical protein
MSNPLIAEVIVLRNIENLTVGITQAVANFRLTSFINSLICLRTYLYIYITIFLFNCHLQTNSVALSPQVNYTD